MMIRRLSAAALGLLVCAAPLAAHADATQAYYERTVMLAADGHCRLFAPELASALAAAGAQARGAALRSGANDLVLDQVAQRARSKAGAAACSSPDIATAAARVRSAFEGYSKLQKMTYPGDVSTWLAVRASPVRTTVWKLSQPARFGANSAVLGLAGRDGGSMLLATASFPDGAAPYTARLVLRDKALASSPYLNTIRASTGPLPLPARMPPRAATTAFLPEAHSGVDPQLLPPGARDGTAFRFPKAAAASLSALDPREAVAIDFVFAGVGGDQVRTAYFEVGDFAAGRAFLAANQR
jgi:hypothetical protein